MSSGSDDLEDVAVGILEPGAARVAHRGDAVLGLDARHVVFLEDDAVALQLGDHGAHVVHDEARERVPALSCAVALVDAELRFARARETRVGLALAALDEPQAELPLVEGDRLVQVGDGNVGADTRVLEHAVRIAPPGREVNEVGGWRRRMPSPTNWRLGRRWPRSQARGAETTRWRASSHTGAAQDPAASRVTERGCVGPGSARPEVAAVQASAR